MLSSVNVYHRLCSQDRQVSRDDTTHMTIFIDIRLTKTTPDLGITQ